MPNNWKKHKLSEVTNRIGDGLHGTPIYDDNGEYFFINGNNLNNGRIDIKTETKRVDKSEYEKHKKDLDESSILLSINGTIGNLAFYRGEKCMLGKSACYINLIKGTDVKYMYYVFLSPVFQKFLKDIATGTTIPNVPLKGIRDFEFSLPPLPEQQAIAEILSALDDKIELNLQTNKTLEEMANALYKHWFVDFGPFKNGKFIQSELGMIPEEWEVKKTSSLFDLTIGRTPPRKEQHWFSEDIRDIKWISIKDMGTSGAYIFSTSEYLTKEAVEKHNVPLIPQNTVVLSFKLTVGRISITSEEMTSNEAIAHFIPNSKNHLSTEFTYLLLKNFNFDQLGSTSSIATAVNSQTIKNIDFLYPSKNHIELFNAHVGNLFEQIKLNIVETETLKQTRDYLLPKLISGQIRIKDAVKLF